MNSGLIFFRVAKYLNYIIVSDNRRGHGIHSPFVFDLVNRVFRNKTDSTVVYSIEKIRRRLKGDKRKIAVRDLGSGSEKPGSNLKKVSEIARFSAVNKKYGMLLAKMAAEFAGPLIIEFGTSFGISTMYMASSCRDTHVASMEGCPATTEIADLNFKEAGLTNITLHVGPFEDIISEIVKMGITPGMVFIDGNHRKEPVLEYFDKMAEVSDNKTVIIIDDIYFSAEMSEAWDEIRKREKVTLTVDLFRMGIVFFRSGMGRKEYIIRY
ncbi:MAG: class I SAM-dependent methyltransferase [Bacteroidales bacterium]|nr:class I SAM-dependent methyltransferase [Bacteroidales bacterium]